jgi:hypothetical protein
VVLPLAILGVYNAGMADRPTYSLQILLGTIAAFAVAAAAFGAPPSAMSGLLVAILGAARDFLSSYGDQEPAIGGRL